MDRRTGEDCPGWQPAAGEVTRMQSTELPHLSHTELRRTQTALSQLDYVINQLLEFLPHRPEHQRNSPMSNGTTTVSELESHLWEAANILRGPVDAADFKTYVFPLLFFKRISDVHDEEYQTALTEADGDEEYLLRRNQTSRQRRSEKKENPVIPGFFVIAS